MVCRDTLRVKHLPKELTDAQKEDFMRHFGAQKVKVITSKAKAKSIVYAKFENADIAKSVMHRLHQITVLTCRLSVEYAETDVLQGQLSTQKVEEPRDGPDKKFFKSFINNINAFNESVGFYQPPPSHLKYNYPRANRPTINNIAHALATVPRFYTQVLHLMNKMNLPPPFAMPDPPVRAVPAVQQLQPSGPANKSSVTQKRKTRSSSESELESDEETKKKPDIVPEKRPVTQKKSLPVKRPKFIKQSLALPDPVKPIEKKNIEDVFETTNVHALKKIELKVIEEPIHQEIKVVKEKEEIAENKEVNDQLEKEVLEVNVDKKLLIELSEVEENLKQTYEKTGTSGPVEPQLTQPLSLYDDNVREDETEKVIQEEPSSKRQEEELVQQSSVESKMIEAEVTQAVETQHTPVEQSLRPPSPDDEFPCISLEELAANQVTDLSVMSVFKNYSPGEPTNKLYIKNCAKTVAVQDLEYIYNRYREECAKGKPSEFNIRLMQEGRMKGQAFVTLDSVEQAQRAVKETNGFILKDKPLVVVFGKAGKKS